MQVRQVYEEPSVKSLDRHTALETVRATLALDCACDPACFVDEGVFIVEARALDGRRRFPRPAQPFMMMTMGRGVVIACSAERLSWARAQLGTCDRKELFSITTLAQIADFVAPAGQRLMGPNLQFLCSGDSLRTISVPTEITLELVSRECMAEAYAHPGFRYALSYQLDNPCPDMLAVLARHNGAVIGIAAVSADNDQLWQIGVELRPEYQGRGIGKALVSRVTEATLAAGKTPYYATWISNLASSHTAVSVGYWLAWTEAYVHEP